MGVVKAIGEQHAVQVISLVLRHAGLKTVDHRLPRLPAGFTPGKLHRDPALHLTTQTPARSGIPPSPAGWRCPPA